MTLVSFLEVFLINGSCPSFVSKVFHFKFLKKLRLKESGSRSPCRLSRLNGFIFLSNQILQSTEFSFLSRKEIVLTLTNHFGFVHPFKFSYRKVIEVYHYVIFVILVYSSDFFFDGWFSEFDNEIKKLDLFF